MIIPGDDMVWGGNPEQHNIAQVEAWKEILHFLKYHLKEESNVTIKSQL